MRKVFLFNMTTLDGFFEGPNQDISWHQVDDEFNEFAVNQLKEVDMLLFGRVTYQGMASYWPTEFAIKDDPMVAGLMNSLPKIVFSKTLDKAEWNNSRLVSDHAAKEVSKLKEQPGKDIAIFGSSDLVVTLADAAPSSGSGLIDEYRIIVNPVFLGAGTPLLKGIKDKLELKLLKARTFKSSNVLLYYAPEKDQ
jgi:dihydrofolate reductase